MDLAKETGSDLSLNLVTVKQFTKKAAGARFEFMTNVKIKA
jgi:hypothetical protein